MQQALPYTRWLAVSTSSGRRSSPEIVKGGRDQSSSSSAVSGGDRRDQVKSMVTENAVVVFGRRGCCLSHVVKRLLQGLGANPTVFEVDEEEEVELCRFVDDDGEGNGNTTASLDFPVVFVAGKLFGGLDKVMATHISGELVPVLKEAGALWL